ncbi:MAG: hypothetical protein RR891_07670 [Clostridium sp.]
MSISILVPKINAATITPNPINANTTFLISINISEVEQILEPSISYCGTISASEQIII